MSFEFDGEKYKKASSHQKEWANKILEELHFKGNEIILDLGCGDGAITNQLAEMVPAGKVVGIDASKGMIKTALKDKKQSNIYFEHKDINEIIYSEEFDFIFSNATLHWVKDHVKFLSNIFRALKNKGALRFNFAGDGNCSHFFKVIKHAMTEDGYSQYFKDYSWPWFMPTIKAYQKLAEEAEFSEIKIWGENADRYFENSETMVKWIDQPSIVPFLKHIPEPEKDNFRNYVVERMINETKQEDGTCFETFRRVNVKAVKSL
jgi:trans-aconitate 2-methyltransferase